MPVVLPCLERIHIITQEVVMMPLRKMPDTRLHSTFLLFNGVKSTYLSRYHESTQDSVLETDLLLLSSHLLLTAKYSGDKTVKVSKRLNNIKKISCLVGWCGMYLPNYKYELSCIILQMHTLYNGRLHYASPKRFMS